MSFWLWALQVATGFTIAFKLCTTKNAGEKTDLAFVWQHGEGRPATNATLLEQCTRVLNRPLQRHMAHLSS